jgi:hypothetical protein
VLTTIPPQDATTGRTSETANLDPDGREVPEYPATVTLPYEGRNFSVRGTINGRTVLARAESRALTLDGELWDRILGELGNGRPTMYPEAVFDQITVIREITAALDELDEVRYD